MQSAIRRIASHEFVDLSGPTCISSSFAISVKALLETIARLTGFNGRIVWDTIKPNGQPRRKLDVSRALPRLPGREPPPHPE